MTDTPATLPDVKRPLWAGRSLALIGIVLAAFNLRTAVTSLPPLFDVVGADLGFGNGFISVLGMMPTAAFAVFGFSTPAIARRFGLEATAIAAMVLAAGGQFGRSAVDSPTWFLILSVVSLAGMGAGNVVLPPLVKRYFPDRIGGLSALYLVILQFGTMLPALVSVPMANAAGWRVSLASWGIIAVAAIVPWIGPAFGAHSRRGKGGLVGRSGSGVSEPRVDTASIPGQAPRGRVRRSPVAIGLTLMFGTTSLNTYAMFTWLPKIVVDAGRSAAFGGVMLSLFSGLGLIAGLVMPIVATKVRNPFPVVWACIVFFAAGYLGLWLSPAHGTVLWVILIGLGPSTFPMSLTLVNVRTRTASGSAALSGFVQGIGYAFACLGPLLFGLVRDATGAWTAPFGMLGISLIVLLIGGYFACRPQYLEDTWHAKAQARK